MKKYLSSTMPPLKEEVHGGAMEHAAAAQFRLIPIVKESG